MGMCPSPSEVEKPGTGGTLTSTLVPAPYRPLGAGHSRAGEPLTLTQRIHAVPEGCEGAAVASPAVQPQHMGAELGICPAGLRAPSWEPGRGFLGFFSPLFSKLCSDCRVPTANPAWPSCAHPQPPSQHTERFPAPFRWLIPSIPPLAVALPHSPKGRGAPRVLCCHPGPKLLLFHGARMVLSTVQPVQLPTLAPSGGRRLFPAVPRGFSLPFPLPASAGSQTATSSPGCLTQKGSMASGVRDQQLSSRGALGLHLGSAMGAGGWQDFLCVLRWAGNSGCPGKV